MLTLYTVRLILQESTRDIPLFQGAANSSASYFEYNQDKLKDISWLLEGGGDKPGAGVNGVSALRGDAARLEGMKRLIAVSRLRGFILAREPGDRF